MTDTTTSTTPIYEARTAADTACTRLRDPLSAVGIKLWVKYAPFDIAGSGDAYAVCLEASDGWQRDQWHTGVRHAILVMNFYADHQRDADHRPVALNAHSRALAMYERCDTLLDLQTSDTWTEVVTSRRQGEPQLFDVPDGDGAVMLSARYELALFNSNGSDVVV
ncbi:hypothetical protein [Allobranchiibius sp. CTAmp26]|uniref:hypothetical protein n=1 Tax=Allobranchiibius sp. CTAmp26 TaxID=2815214 RepID=UPI001AA1BC8E|nr:hypothetical protein [Allobranchiibius sp. CTAmp26]MBO1755703.1 hypothetical protein [Allobranchiibius sp. CTAmp26]